MKFSFISAAVAVFVVAVTGNGTSAPAAGDSASNVLNALESRKTHCTWDALNRLLFDAPMRIFADARKSHNPRKCDWTSDDCKWIRKKPVVGGVNFTLSCQRFDFGYKNMKKQSRFTTEMKEMIDEKFKFDLDHVCMKVQEQEQVVECQKAADYYANAALKHSKRDEDDDFEGSAMSIELDPSIPGQWLPKTMEGVDNIEDLDAWLGEKGW